MMWKHCSLVIDVVVTLIIVALIYTGVMDTFDYCTQSHRCIVVTSLVVTAMGLVYFIVTVYLIYSNHLISFQLVGITFMKLYLRERYGILF
jgi:hypothetical protein